jgi:hypothetical protein
MASRMLLMSSVFISRPLDLVLVNALILIRRDLGMVEVVWEVGEGEVKVGRLGGGKIPQDDFLANRCAKRGAGFARGGHFERGPQINHEAEAPL